MNVTLKIIFVISSFLLGGIYFSKLITYRVCNKNVCEEGDDGNPGAANAWKICGRKWGFLAFLCDFLKGFVPVFVACFIFGKDSLLLPVIVVMPVLGSALGIFNRLRGGKSISVSFGVMAGTLPLFWGLYILAISYIVLSGVLRIKPDGVSTIIAYLITAAVSLPLAAMHGLAGIGIAYAIVCCIVIFRHAIGLREEINLYRQRKTEQ